VGGTAPLAIHNFVEVIRVGGVGRKHGDRLTGEPQNRFGPNGTFYSC
jgi:hypothetical protein